MANVNGNDQVYIGGIRFNANQIQSSKETGRNNFEVKLKTGQILIFHDQTGSERKLLG